MMSTATCPQVMLDWFPAILAYTYMGYMPAQFRAQGISPVITQVIIKGLPTCDGNMHG
jgi:hypothetical protein